MVAQEKWILEPIYIQNHDIYKYICEYYPSIGIGKEISRVKEIESRLSKGFYVNVNDILFGVFASNNGPKIFKGNEQFLLEKDNYQIELKEKSHSNIFILKIHEREKIVLEYTKQRYVNYDVWSDEETVDFFVWLYKNQNQGDFHKYYIV